jgi:hypothetical protein
MDDHHASMEGQSQYHRRDSTFMPISGHDLDSIPTNRDSGAGPGRGRVKVLLAKVRALFLPDSDAKEPQPSHRDRQPDVSFSTILTNTLEKLIPRDGENAGYSPGNGAVQALLHANLDKV